MTPPPHGVYPNHKGTAKEPSPELSDATASARKERHQQFIAEWCAAYENDWSQNYRVTGRDAKAVKTLATESHDIDELIWTAQQAWKQKGATFWNCQRAVTIHFFAEHLNEIRAELALSKPAPAIETRGERKF